MAQSWRCVVARRRCYDLGASPRSLPSAHLVALVLLPSLSPSTHLQFRDNGGSTYKMVIKGSIKAATYTKHFCLVSRLRARAKFNCRAF